MERCRSSEAAIGAPGLTGTTSFLADAHGGHGHLRDRERDGRRREPKTTSLLLQHSFSSSRSRKNSKDRSRSSTPSPSSPLISNSNTSLVGGAEAGATGSTGATAGAGVVSDKADNAVGPSPLALESTMSSPAIITTTTTPTLSKQDEDDKMDIDMVDNSRMDRVDVKMEMDANMDVDGDVDMDAGMDVDMNEIVPVPTEDSVRQKQEQQEEQAPAVWGMPKWGMEEEEVRKGVRLLSMNKVRLGVASGRHAIRSQPGRVPSLMRIAPRNHRAAQPVRRTQHSPVPLVAWYQR